MFETHAARIAANTLAAQCQDLGMSEITRYSNGTVSAVLAGRTFLFAWDVQAQAVVQVQDLILVVAA